MALTLIPIIIAACFFLLSYFLIRSNRQTMQLKKTIEENNLQLKQEAERQVVLTAELNELKEKQTQEFLYDSLSGLPGRQMFEDRLKQVFNQSKRNQLNFAVMFVDIDGFKVVNEALGHDVGDELLTEIAIRFKNTIRTVDTISRFAGDEFVLILSQLSKPETAGYVAQRLLDAVSQPFKVRDQELFITASIGIAIYPTDGDDPKLLLQNADNAMHQAKARGRNMYQFFHSDMHTLSKRELMLTSSLQQPEIFRDFVLFYQPIFNVETKQVVCMQGLLFWQHPDFGLMPMQDFLKLAEDNGKILDVGDWLLNNALLQFSKWETNELQANAIAIQVSPRQLENPRFAYKLSQSIQEMNLDPGHLILEISENSLPMKLDLLEKMFNMLKHVGVQIAIKDFGTGQLSLQYLKRFSIDYLKIAGSLIKDMTVNKDNEAIVKMIIALGQSSQMKVIAEGVETQKQKELLKALGCNIMQGSFFSAPLKAEEFSRDTFVSLNDK